MTVCSLIRPTAAAVAAAATITAISVITSFFVILVVRSSSNCESDAGTTLLHQLMQAGKEE